MKLVLVGHSYKYAVEQIMLALFPKEKPNYSSDALTESDELIMTSRFQIGDKYAQATTCMRCGDRVSHGIARIKRDKLKGKIMTDRLSQRIIKQSFYRAALVFLDTPPIWGSLTGIRPASIALEKIESGISKKSAIKELTRLYYVSRERAEMCVQAAAASLALKQELAFGDIALYIGIPFCPSRCAYCSFVSNSVEKSFDLIEPFVKTLLKEIDLAAKVVNDHGLRVIAIYIGGGTPTVLPPDYLEAIMAALKSAFDITSLREYTLEAGRPDTIDDLKLRIATRYGADRVCVNPQSMSAETLAAIGRNHSPEETFNAVRLVRRFNASLNMDVIAGLPGDTPESFSRTLDTLLELAPENITVHTLSLKKGSRIMLDGTARPCGADVSEMLGYASRCLRGSGYEPYYLYKQKYTSGGFENTGWSRPGHEGIYNICMMEELCTVLALGGGGVTKLVSANGNIERIFNAKYPREYIMQADKMKMKYERLMKYNFH
ncbi:MAG: coproporphyrinogen dehydrogenase HemZ [Oscillospiraceae bacterium]|nr:coproporphyrinogen dehydrogenase HemZ [Oscillospiraceae bacterium]